MPATPRFFCPRVAAGPLPLPPDEAHHARTVLRLHPGDAVVLFDGNGTEGRGTIRGMPADGVLIDLTEIAAIPFDHSVRLTLATAVPRMHRQHFLVEKCTELGAYAIQPLLCERSVVRPGDPIVPKWTRIAIEAAKQSRRAWVPRIEPPRSLSDALAQAPRFDATVILLPDPQSRDFAAFTVAHSRCATIQAFIGPEGGFTADEIDIASRAGAVPVHLGPSILRIETAALALAAIVSSCLSRRADRIGEQAGPHTPSSEA